MCTPARASRDERPEKNATRVCDRELGKRVVLKRGRGSCNRQQGVKEGQTGGTNKGI